MNEYLMLFKLTRHWLREHVASALRQCWQTRPRFQRCEICRRRVARYGEPSKMLCDSPACKALDIIPF